MSLRILLLSLLLSLSLTGGLAGLAQETTGPQEDPYRTKIAPASREGLLAIKKFEVPKGLQVDLMAAEPLLANPVSFCIDGKGRFFVAETFRLHAGVTDNRNQPWLKDDLACRTVADRLAMYRKYLGKNFDSYGKNSDRVQMLTDSTGSGKLDKSVIFADGFYHPEEGLGAGLIARNGKVWYTNIPNLWLLEDTHGVSRADVKKPLQTGYGVHVSFIGHDLHGLKFGPDGKLYFSSGDRGLHVVSEGKIINCPDTGAVLRCNPDGSELELFATGLRNPQELVFDEFGNLFTGDNNADSGDLARWVYVVEGGDSGWRIGYQYLRTPPAALGPWNAEKLWHLRFPGQAAYIVPPVGHIASGPSGVTYHPGISLLPDNFRRHFFLCDFRGGPANSGIHAFTIKPSGAGFEMAERKHALWSVLATDVDFGPDGGLYLIDWVNGWELPRKGRIYKLYDPGKINDPKVSEVKKLLAEGFAQRPTEELVRLLEHDDMRIRQEAQFALAERKAARELGQVALHGKHLLARLHGIWGLGQVGRKGSVSEKGLYAKEYLWPILTDPAAEVKAQAAKNLGEWKHTPSLGKLLPLLKDESLRVRFFAAQSLGQIGDRQAFVALVEMLRDNADKDAFLRHAGMLALARIGDRKGLTDLTRDASAAVRLAALLAMRRLHMAEIAVFLSDADPLLVLEAARAIHDEPIAEALPQLAALAGRSGLSEALTYRALNAHFRLGRKEDAVALAQYAARPTAPEAMRLEALRHLSSWAKPSTIDRVTGLYYPLAPRAQEPAAEALRATLGGIFTGSSKIQAEAARVAGKLGIKEVGPALLQIVSDKDRPAQVRVESLKALAALKDQRLAKAMNLALASDQPDLRAEGRSILAKQDPQLALPELESALKHGKLIEQQGALADLGGLKYKQSDDILDRWLDLLLKGQVPPELRLDLIEAAGQRSDPAIKRKLALYEKSKSTKDELAKYRETLYGGNSESGRRIFLEKSEVSCVRCHKINGVGGDVGPDLSHIGKEQKREYLLESIVLPSKQIAKGYDSVALVLTDGKIVTGILKGEDAQQVRLMTPEGTLLTVPVNQIEERVRGKSAMPEDLIQHLSRRELRDLVEFLSGLW